MWHNRCLAYKDYIARLYIGLHCKVIRWITLQGLRLHIMCASLHCIPKVTLQGLHRKGYVAKVTLQGLHCIQGYVARIELQWFNFGTN